MTNQTNWADWELRMAFATYIRVRSAHGYDQPLTEAEIQHSALLGRLLEGKPIFPDPPPRAFSYPWYSLIETGEGWASPPEDPRIYHECNPNVPGPRDYVVICQSNQWELLKKNTPTDWVVRCTTNNQIFRCYERDDYEASGLKEDGTYGVIYMRGWKLERLDNYNYSEN